MNGPPSLPSPRPLSKDAPLAIWSLVLGIFSLVCCASFITGIPAIVCGHKARSRIRSSGGTLTGRGLALAGLITGYLGTALGAIALLTWLTVAITNHLQSREWPAENNCLNNLRMLEGAKQQWALENKKHGSDVPTAADVDEYLRGGFKAIRCPQGGTYTLNAVDRSVTCSVKGHSLPPHP
jgi:hypothetical protein